MKRFLFLIMLLSIGSVIATEARVFFNDFKEISFTVTPNNKGKDNLPDNDTQSNPGPITRGIILQPVSAYLYNNVLAVTFMDAYPAASITITNEATAEIVYSETCNNQANLNIDLNGEGNGNYLIEIETDDTFLTGNFSL